MTGSEAGFVKGALEILKLAKEEGWLDKLKALLKKRTRVLVLGSTGVGKTNLLHALTQPLPKAIDSINRSEFAHKHKLVISDEPFEFNDTPGQELHDARRRVAIREQMAKGPTGTMNVVAYGYHEYAIARADVFGSDGQVRPEYLERHRENEIKALGQWTSLLGDPQTTKWLVTVVTKADLWWDNYPTVIAHYTTGPYFQALGPAQSLTPVTVEFASVMHRFFGRGALSGDFDDATREQLRSRLFATLLQAIGK